MRSIVILLAICVSLGVVQTSRGGWLDNVIERSAQRATERVIDRAARESSDAAYDKTKEGIKNGNRDESSESEPSDRGSSGRRSSDRRGESSSRDNDVSDSDEPSSGEVYSNRFDFIAGDKVIFFEDFSDTPPGDYPSRWTPGDGKNPVEVVEFQGKHWLKSLAEGQGYMRDASSFMRVDLNKELPEKFTVEFDMPATADLGICFTGKYWATGSDSVRINPKKTWMPGSTENFNVSRSKNPIRHVSIAVSGTNVKVYFDGERVLLAPDGVRRHSKSIRTIGFAFHESGGPRQDQMVTNIRLAEGGKDYAKELVNGRIVTHGITFDTGSAVLKPQSGPTLWKIHKFLVEDAGLSFEVQGHTDNTGSSSSNQTLSEDRADSVRNWLVDQGIDGGRLTTKGFGDSKPMSSNDTPEGRANNRRVEFVKM